MPLQVKNDRDAENMNPFDQKLKETGMFPLKAERVAALLVSLGCKCDRRCTHCYIEASPDRTEEMSPETMEKILSVLGANSEIKALDITGGAPELNAHYKYFVKSAADMDRRVIVRSNLTVFFQPGKEDIPDFLADNGIKISASLPCYTEEGVDRQRGKGAYRKIIAALKRLNGLGYGKAGTGLELDIAFNPPEASRAPDRQMLEKLYREKLMELHGITFNNLAAISNVPVGRLRGSMTDEEYNLYLTELEKNFNPDNVGNVLCREQLYVSYDGELYDCGFNCMQQAALKSPCSHIGVFDYDSLSTREIATTRICFVCTAGAGLGCTR